MSDLAELYATVISTPSDIYEHLPTLRQAATATGPGGVVVELGVAHARSTVALLCGVIAGGGHLWSFDLEDPCRSDRSQFPNDGYGPLIEGHPYWTFAIDDSRRPSYVMPRPQLVFLDTSHRYADTVTELAVWSQRIDKGGTILLHDTRTAIDGEYGVLKAVVDFLHDHHGEWRWSENPACNGLGTLVKQGEAGDDVEIGYQGQR